MAYSFNLKKEPFAFALREEVNASYKDLGAVCDAVRYLKASSALSLLDAVADMRAPVPYRRHNKYMGSRRELAGAKGAYPVKAAREVRSVLSNAIANADNRGMEGSSLYVIHAAATKTRIERRSPSKGSLSWGRGRYGRSSAVRSNLEYARIEVGLGAGTEEELTSRMRYFIKAKNAEEAKKAAKAKPVAVQKKGAHQEPKADYASKAKPAAEKK